MNIIGLSIGFSAYILITLFVRYDYSWDKHNANYDRIYRVQRIYTKAVAAMDGNNISPHTHGITAKLIEAAAPEIEKTMILEESGRYLSSSPGNLIFERNGILSESSIFDLFTYHFTEGEASTALSEPNSIVLSTTLASRLFPHGHALGSMVMIEKKVAVRVTGIFEDLPQNSIIRPQFIISISTVEQSRNVRDSWTGNHMTYVLLKKGQDPKLVESKIRDAYNINKYHEEEKLSLCPLSMLYLSFNGEDDYFIILMLYRLIGIFILILAAFNFINLSTANAGMRTREIAVRKVHGSSKFTLVRQILGESVMIALLAVGLAFLIVENFLPVYDRMVNKDIQLSYIKDFQFVLTVAGIAILVGLFSGLYPAFFLANHKITSLLKGNMFRTRKETFAPKKVLVLIQFSIAVFLLIITLAFSDQIKYMITRNLGFEMKNKVFTKFLCSNSSIHYDDVKARLLQHPEIKNACFAQHIPFVSFGGGNIDWEGCQPGESVNVRFNGISYDFLDCFHIPVIQGRGFSRDFPGDSGKSCIINETAWKSFGWKDPIGKRLAYNQLVVVGVVKDYQYKDIHNGIEPAILVLRTEPTGGEWTFAFDVEQGSSNKVKQILQKEFEASFPNDAFEFDELPDAFRRENTLQVYFSVDRTIIFFTVLNILIAVMGLLGLVSFTTQRRTKEIGIRKINGGSSWSMFSMMSREYLMLILISSLISWPAAYLMYDMLPGANKQPIHYFLFLLATGLVLIIALFTTSYQTLKASLSNPVNALRYE